MRNFVLIFVVLCFSGAALAVPRALDDAEVTGLLDSLDREMLRQDYFLARKQERIHRLREAMAAAADDSRRFWVSRDLYEEYSTFDSDSAMAYLSMGHRLASQMGRQDLVDEIRLDKCYIMSATGLLDKAKNELDSVDPGRLPEPLMIKYHENRIFLMTHMGQFLGEEYPSRPYSMDVDNLLQDLNDSLPMTDSRYWWILGWSALRSPGTAARVIPRLSEQMEHCGYDSRDDARQAWILAQLYKQVEDSVSYFKYLTLSAMSDLRSCNKEIASLEELSYEMLVRGRFERANNYITYCIRSANDYKSRTRVGHLSDLQHRISEGYSDALAHKALQLKRVTVFMVVILIVLLVALALIIWQVRSLRQSRRRLDHTNAELNERVAELNEARASLKEANERLTERYSSARRDARELSEINEAKEKYIADIFAICSNYISKIDDFRKKINRMIVAGRLDDVRALTKTSELSQGELRELYANFDRIFLQIYPDFVADFNTLLQPDKQIVPRKDELLTTDLRIYALVRLGLNDSVKIAKFLHCSVQTVYNTRMRTRNKARVPRDEFASYVRRLGTADI